MPYWLDDKIDDMLLKKYHLSRRWDMYYSPEKSKRREAMNREKYLITSVYTFIKKLLLLIILCGTFNVWFPLLIIGWFPLAVHICIF
jgi:hypothetical protein